MLIKHKQFGFTLIEVLVSVLTLSILIVGVYNLLIYSLQITTDNKNRMGAIMIADQKAEYVRNLPYDDVGTVAGIVTGVMQDNETVSANNGTFNVNIFVQYEDDPYDGTLGGAPDDILPTDYKQVRIRVSWSGPFGTKNVTTFTKIAPRGMETSAGGGVLTVLVFDSNGLPINDASVHIENNILATPINFDAETSANGILNLPGAPESIEGYEITVTKAGYSTDYTSARVVGVNDNPTKPHSTVLENQRTNVSFAIDLLSVLTIEAVTASMPRNWPGSHDTSGETQSNGRIAIDNSSFVYVVWDDYRSASAAKIYTQKHDSIGNAQWPDTSSPSDINIATANNTVIPDVLVDSFGNLYISWHDDSVGNKEAYLSKRDSSDGSDLWGSGKRINTIADSAHQSYPRIALMDDGITATTTAVWQDDRNTDWDIFMQIFDYDGDYQLSPESRVNTNGLFDGSDQYEPVVVADLSYNIYISWTDDRNGNLDIYAQKYGIDGVSLWAPDLLCNNDGGATDQYSPDIAMDSLGNIYIVWADARNGDLDIYAQRYDSTGASSWAGDVRINTDSGSEDQHSPSIAIDSANNIYIVWVDERNGDQDIYAQKYLTDGNNLWTDDIRVNMNNDTSAQRNPDIVIDPITDEPYVSWEDDRSGNWDIYVSKFTNYHGSESPAINVPITITGLKRIGEAPIIYKYDQDFSTNSSGDVILNNMEWDSYTVDLQAGYTDHVIIISEPVFPVDLAPNSSQTIKLYLQ